ncbi:Uncharacterized protein SAPIO_CDS0863 [Scedosporium apiospermum]|uniref:Ubiquitin-protein ligase n=1 Tax=Pseudallescheria apiosperma TaxID=563466 RepID=A0A084GGQ6_PSEDA|nr:Uncharacterized protein SAPIO_CDS0863 [Scedosporium apiospermum]KEZ46518.1 Uncharacterized protein SAPIO_CDS0863 [Scedosporium apiospermum]
MDDHLPDLPSGDTSRGIWYNFTTWTAQQLKYTVNVTKYAPSLEDLVWAGPRIVRRLGSIIFLPDAIEGPHVSGPALSDSLQNAYMMASDSAPNTVGINRHASGSSANPLPGPLHSPVDGTRGFGSVFSYATSKWALCCIAMAIILNRAYIFAATRRRLVLPWHIRVLIRGAPIVLLGLQARHLLQSIQCQTSPEFPSMRWGDTSKHSELMFPQTNTFLHGLSSTLLLNPTDRESCVSIHMIPQNTDPSRDVRELKGSLSLLWPLFGTFCLSQLLETIVCAVEGRTLSAETGMTLFEHSLAFAEADAAISNQLGWGVFNSHSSVGTSATSLNYTMAVSRSMILQRVNTSPEVLLVAFLSSMAHITSHLLGTFNLQAKFRLLSTTLWGLSFMGSIMWSVATFSIDSLDRQSLLRFPTVCIIGFIPHVLVLSGIVVCLSIYGFALLLSAIAPPQGIDFRNLNFRQRLAQAQGNLQANISLSDLRISREMDFYTALLRTGFGAITLASEAVYLNEDSAVNTPRHTWLEEQRSRELEEFHARLSGTADVTFSSRKSPAESGAAQRLARVGAFNGYSREKTTQANNKERASLDRQSGNGVGAAARSGRWLVALDYMLNIYRVVMKTWALMFLKILEKLGIRSQPPWLLWLFRGGKSSTGRQLARPELNPPPSVNAPQTLDGIWIPRGDHVDVEAEVRKRVQATARGDRSFSEEELDARLYSWWLHGGTWGSVDRSGDYAASESESITDNTSVISRSRSDQDDEEWGEEYDQNTLLQLGSPSDRETSPAVDSPIQLSDLARLLHPKTLEDQEEADALSAHLASDEILTRSRSLGSWNGFCSRDDNKRDNRNRYQIASLNRGRLVLPGWAQRVLSASSVRAPQELSLFGLVAASVYATTVESLWQ